MPESKYFGYYFSGVWKYSVGDVGNYGEIFERNFVDIIEHKGRNNLKN